jgi:DNA repair exonuclease SbcCD ATPase subunit
MFMHREAIAKEREEQREIREQMKEEEKARRDLERAQVEAEKDTERYAKALSKARQDVEQANGERQQKLLAEISRLETALTQAEAQKQRAIAQAQLTRSGYVYVISNIGAFGENVYKIGMTRRLDPQDRVDELGDASVPFPFDVHAMIYTNDAPTLENALHRAFANSRVNLVNFRKEFFRVRLEDIEKVAKNHNAQIAFTLVAKADQYRQSESIRI